MPPKHSGPCTTFGSSRLVGGDMEWWLMGVVDLLSLTPIC
jgi:hypothetical protein